MAEITQSTICNVLIVFLFFAVSVSIGALFFKWFTGESLRRKLTRRVRRAADGEKNAHCYLREHGFTVLDEQAHITKKLMVDGVTVPFALRADFIVQKGGRYAVVDAKSGSRAADPRNPETRRRMLEYFCYYDVSDAYIYDDISKSLKKIDFADITLHKKDWKLFITGAFWGCMSSVVFYLLMKEMVEAFF